MYQWLCALVAPLVALLLVLPNFVETARRDKGRTVALVAFDDPIQRDAFDSKTDDQNDDAGRYYPLKVGNAWQYKIADAKFVYKITRLEKVGDQTCARIEMSVGDKAQAVEHVALKDGSICRYQFEGKQAEPPVKFLERPDQVGHTWKVKSTIGQEKLAGTFKIGKVDKVTVPAGTFHNVVTSSSDDMDANGQKIGFTYYFAKDVGMIKQTIKIHNQEVTIELEKFEPADGKATADRKPPD
jgi:hypothetical protein